MSIRNNATGVLCILSAHAKDRWLERFGDYPAMVEAVRDAVPFGVQMGKDLLLCHDDAVFATSPADDYPGQRVVRTVLPKAMALANLRVQHFTVAPVLDADAVAYDSKKLKREGQRHQKALEAELANKVNTLTQRAAGVGKMSDADLQSFIDAATAFQQGLHGVPHSRKYRTKGGKALFTALSERSRRRKEIKTARKVMRLVEGEWKPFAESLVEPKPAGAGAGEALKEEVSCP